MKINNPNESVFKPIENKHNDKANEVFLKLLARQKRPANPFGVVKSETYPTKEIKPGGNANVTV